MNEQAAFTGTTSHNALGLAHFGPLGWCRCLAPCCYDGRWCICPDCEDCPDGVVVLGRD